MKLSDQEQVILKAIGHGVVEIARVIRAVGYPKAATKKVLVRLNEKGVIALHRHDYPQSLTPAQRKLMVRIGNDYFNAVSMRKRNPIRFEIGRRLSKTEKDEVLRSLGDSYKDFHAPKILKSYDRVSGDPIYGYEYNPDFMYRSDITGRLIRHYITLPDGRRAHPTELYPNLSKTEIDKYAMEREHAERLQKSRDRSREDRIANDKATANEKYKATGRKIEGSYFAQHSDGRIVRVDGKFPDDAAYYEARGFKQVTQAVKNPKGKHLAGATAKQQRQYEAIKKSELKRGKSSRTAKRIAAATVRKQAKNPPNTFEVSAYNKQTKRTEKWIQVDETARKALARVKESVLYRSRYFSEPNIYTHWKVKAVNPKRGKRNASGSRRSVRSSSSRRRSVPRGQAKRTSARKNVAVKRKASRPTKARSVAKARTVKARRVTAGKRRNAPGLAEYDLYIIEGGRKKRAGSIWARSAKQAETAYKRQTDYKGKVTAAKKSKSNPMRKGMRKLYGQAKALQRHDPKRKSMLRKAARGGKQIMRRVERKNPSAESIRKQFAGSVNGERDLFFPQGTPSGKLAKLGKLVSITTEKGTIKPVSGTAWLCADTKGKLHIGSVSGANLFDGPARNFGHVTKLEYESSKPHLGYKGPIIWFHKAGEENGVRPTLRADGQGGLVFKGGAYRLTRRGIEN